MTLLLSKNDVMQVLDMPDTIKILEHAFQDLAQDNAVMPQRTPITSPEYGGLALFMPAYLRGMGAMGAKVVQRLSTRLQMGDERVVAHMD